MIYEFDPKKYRFAVEIGVPKKRERLKDIPQPGPHEKVAAAINANLFTMSDMNTDGYGLIMQDGIELKPVTKDFPCMCFKDGKMIYGYTKGAQVGVNLAMLLILDGKINIQNPAHMTTGKDDRTGVGQYANGNILFITEENVTSQELAQIMLDNGCAIAFQCDSGDSTGILIGDKLYDHGRAIAGALVAYERIDGMNLVIAYSQQKNNKCAMGDTEQDHMYTIAKALYDILTQDKRINTYLIPRQNTGTDSGNLKASIKLSNDFIKANGAGYHIELHSDAGGYAKGCSALYKSEKGKKLATYLYNELADLTPTTDAGIRKRDDLGALNQTKAVAALIEVSFHDSQEEARWIHESFMEIAVRICNGFYKFMKGENL